MKSRRLLLAVFLATIAGQASAQTAQAEARCVAEVTLHSAKAYGNPFTDVDVDAIVTEPGGKQRRIPAFWDGQGTWKFRYSSSVPGTHTFTTVSTDASNPDLKTRGTIKITPYTGSNKLYVHGAMGIAGDHRHFQYEDGTPFFWLGDTWWKGLAKRISDDGFRQLAADRKAKGFSVIQIVAGPYPDEPAFDPRWANDAGMPYEPDYRSVNPAYFDAADKRMQTLVDAELTPAIVGGWGWHMPAVGEAKFIRHWRYLVARYAAYPVVWIIAGEGGGAAWGHVGKALRAMDPYHRAVTIHTFNTSRKSMDDHSVLDFDMLQTGHNDAAAAANTIAELTSSVSWTPPMPVVDGEVTYEGHMMGNREDIQRYMFWSCMLNGAAGHTYGAGGLWQMNSETERGAEYEFTPWSKAMNLPGSTELGIGKRLLERYPWWRFEPHPEWVEPHGTTLLEPHANAIDDAREFAAHGGRADLPYAAGIPNEVRFIYFPGGHFYQWGSAVVRGLEAHAAYHAYYADPVSGKRYELGTMVEPTVDAPFLKDSFQTNSGWKDYGSPSERRSGTLLGTKGMVTVLPSVTERDAQISVGARSDAEAGIILRFQDPSHYVVALYSPSLHAIYFHDRRNSEWGSPLGQINIPALGPHIRLTVTAVGEYAALTISDGTQTFSTPTVQLSNNTPGPIGLWHYQIGDSQDFDSFQISKARLDPIKPGPVENPLEIHDNPGVVPGFVVPKVTFILDHTYHPPRLPAPQDWLLVLEHVLT